MKGSSVNRVGWTIWLTGLPASGKTAIANALLKLLEAKGIDASILDSDDVRSKIKAESQDDYQTEGRQLFYKALVDMAEEKATAGNNVVIAATGNMRSFRQYAREKLSPFAEIFIFAPLEVAIARDAERNPGRKSLYEKAFAWDILNFPGVDAPYEEPESPEVFIDTTRMNVEEAANYLLEAIDFLTIDSQTAN